MARLWQTIGERLHLSRLTGEERARREAALVADYRAVFASPEGRRVLADLLRRSGIVQSSFAADAGEMAYREGRRRIGLEIIEQINRDPGSVLTMLTSGDTAALFTDGDPP